MMDPILFNLYIILTLLINFNTKHVPPLNIINLLVLTVNKSTFKRCTSESSSFSIYQV